MFKRAFFPLLILGCGAAVILWTLQSPLWQALRQISGIMRLVHEEYVDVDAVSYEALVTSAIRGMVESLDPYSRYMSAEDFSRFERSTRQNYVGIGIEIERFDLRVTVITAFPDGPADKAGIRPGDQITAIDNRSMLDATVIEVSDALQGPEGGEATVKVFRPSTDEEHVFTLIRRSVNLASVNDVRLDAGKVGYLRISQFGERTHEEFQQALDRLEAQGMQALIIDLRNNPGGLLSASKDVASEFFDPGELIVFTQGRDPTTRTEFRSDGPARPVKYPLVVLINERSASGAEIVAGALQDGGKAHVIGEKSYGKGSVQSVYAFRNGAGLRQTTALYYLPSGRSIHEKGIEPDLTVEMSEEEERRLRLQSRHRDYLSREDFERVFEHAPDQDDLQLDMAIEYLRQLLDEPVVRS